ncbi:hypothetical protein GPALN_007892 [Globodera pallida]|nr:hypothetical protein GPALN_007892 [Globodera pallida]
MGQLLVSLRGTTNNNAPTPGLRRLFALFSAFLPFGQQRAANDSDRAEAPPRDSDGNHQREAESGSGGRGGFGRRRRHPPPDLSTTGESVGFGGRGSPNNSGGGGCAGGAYFGSHFLMGGELYDSTKPEVFLFGDQQDLELLNSKSVKFPFSAKGVTDSVGVLNALVNVRKDSVKFAKIGRAGGGYSSGFYRLEFIFDCDVSCFVQIHFCAKELIGEQHQPQLFQIVSRQPQFEHSERFHFPVGANQQFNHFTFKPHRYDMKMMHWDGGPFFPVVIEIRSVSDQYPEQVQVTLCSIERSNDQSAVLILKPLKQKLITDGVVFLLQEIFGIENKENAETAPPPLADENGAECIICMANSRDTMILPCRHLCICNGCAETLRYKLNNCPICRSPFKALLKVKAMRNSLIGQGVGSDGSMTTTRIRREPMTLVEAINGPFPSSAPPLPPHSAVGAGTTAGLQHNLPVAESTKSANNRQTTTATSMVARCRGSHIVTSTIVHPSPCCPSSPPPFATYQQLPLGLGSPNVGGSRRDVILIGSEMAGTAAVVDWLRGTKNAQQNEHAFVRNEALLEQIEMGHLRSRKGSHSSAVHCSSNNSFIGRSRSPSLCRTKRHRHSHFSTPNSSYQSAQGQMAGGRGALLERQTRKSTILLASAPNLVDLTLAEVPKAISESGHTFSSSQTEAKQRKRSDTTMTEKGAHSAEGKAKRRARGAKGHVKRRSDPPRGDHDDPMML